MVPDVDTVTHITPYLTGVCTMEGVIGGSEGGFFEACLGPVSSPDKCGSS